MRDATKCMRKSSCSWKKEGTRRQQKYLTVIKQFSTTRTLLPLILSTEGLLGKNLEKNLRKVTLKDISGTKSLSPVTKSFLPAVDCLGILIPSTRGKHISNMLSAAVPHSLSLWLWNLYLAFWAEKSKVAVCDASSTAALYPDATTCGRVSSHKPNVLFGLFLTTFFFSFYVLYVLPDFAPIETYLLLLAPVNPPL